MQTKNSATTNPVTTKIRTVRYSDSSKPEWNRWNQTARNGNFLFDRNYMDYHQDRFLDHSLMFFEEDELVALLPANQEDQTLISHGGLTFGGLISQPSMRTRLAMRILDAAIEYLQTNSIKTLRYKAIPYIYQSVPSDDDLYALFRHNARLIRRDASSTIRMDNRLSYSKGRKHSLKLAERNGLVVHESNHFEQFMALEAEVLARKYSTKPVHTHEEISLLANRFPNNIRLFTVAKNDELLAGVIVYDSEWVSHAQYMGATEEGQEVGALDLIIHTILSEHAASKRFFDFGISTEHEGRYLNEGLVAQKEMFGARTVLYDTYDLPVD
jgi:hypothetical protein